MALALTPMVERVTGPCPPWLGAMSARSWLRPGESLSVTAALPPRARSFPPGCRLVMVVMVGP